MAQQIVIIDTACANLSSVKYAVERLGFEVTITDDRRLIESADKVILPGVGSARHAMENIRAKQLVEVIQNLQQPVLGFCLGMQLMCSQSEEVGFEQEINNVDCLNVIPTNIVALQAPDLPLPHMGWNTLTIEQEHPVLKGLNNGDYVYFVHSYCAPISEYTVASSEYGQRFSAVVAKDNFVGCQFHPERSSQLGSL